MAPAHSRHDLRVPAKITVGLLVAVMTLNLAGIAAGTREDQPGRLDGLWVLLLGGTGISFLRWFVLARRNSASYGPDRVRVYATWTAAGWLCPGVSLWVPFRITAEILRSSAIPVHTGTMPAGGTPRAALLRWWWAMWIGMWLVLWAFVVAYLQADLNAQGVTAVQEVLDLAFQLLSIGAAACAIAVVVAISRHQAQRAAESVTSSQRLPAAAPAGMRWAAGAVAIIAAPLLGVTVLIGARDTAGPFLPPADLAPTASEVTGTWHASDGGTLVFTSDGQFTAVRLSVNLAQGGTPATASWSGDGTWQTGGACDGSGPGICLTVGDSDEDGWTSGAASSPVLLLPVTPPGQDYDAYGYNDEFRK
jgi:hypothetical protein